MRRRDFLRAGASFSMAGALANAPARAALAQTPDPAPAKPGASILARFTHEDHRRRLWHIARCERGIRAAMRKHLITSYQPGQCCYNLGEYPCRTPWNPDEWDEAELDRLRDHGVGLIQVHEEWNDSQRLFGADKLSALNPEGLRRFVEMAHRRGMKVIVYASSGFFDRRDPDFREEWARPQDLVEMYYHYARCSPASAGWRAYLLPRLARILDEYGVDGFYNDLGYVPLSGNTLPPTADEVLAWQERDDRDSALGDLLALIYAEVKRRGGIVKIHYTADRCPRTETKVYDYLWVGESVRNGDSLREAVKNLDPYVVPCLDMSRARIEREDELYLHAMPYLQFPLLLAGRPFTGERASIPGIQYPPEDQCFWTRHCRAIWKAYQEHPEGPHSYGWWDSVPGRPEARPTHEKWLRLYAPMVEEGTWAWLEVVDSDLFAAPVPADVRVSAFAGRDLYLAVANYGPAPIDIQTSDAYVEHLGTPGDASASAPASTAWRVEPRSLRLLRQAQVPERT